MSDDVRPIIVFDSLCPLCSAQAQFVLRHDRGKRFRLASMQRLAGADLFRRFGVDPDDPETLIVVQGGRALRESDAALAIYRGLGWPWRLAGLLALVPRRLRDRAYRWIARNRYRLFGRRSACWVPSAQDRDRLL
ncbi:thiol-disulfide oxidoreductase DCC family protein [Sphingosinicella terrae]|uniref:thiol-disulfide oxidoreductase DCC family protein n=1 Tax=Sphingosinicella terrae TaxID=2172047 RepID=UPI000E0D89FE|nr:DCC1-like thiol-disulfide oxidoreductase family protein [Sphingosinicella terrae]